MSTHDKLVQGFLNFRETAKAKQSDIVKAIGIHDKGLFMTFDGGKQGNHSAMSQSFTSTATGQKVKLPMDGSAQKAEVDL